MTQDALYFVEDDFLSEEECSVLIAIAQKYFGSSGTGFSIHGGRQTHPNTDLDFHDLLKSSEEWRRLDERLSGEEFFQHVFGKLGFKTPGRSFRVIRLFTSEFLFRGPFFGRIKKYTARAFPPGLPTQAIAAILAARFFHFARRLLVGGTNLLTGKKTC